MEQHAASQQPINAAAQPSSFILRIMSDDDANCRIAMIPVAGGRARLFADAESALLFIEQLIEDCSIAQG